MADDAPVLVATVSFELDVEDAVAAHLAAALLRDGAVSTVRIERGGVPSVYRVDVAAEDDPATARARALAPAETAAHDLGVELRGVTVVLRDADATGHPAA